ncbi:MAG: ADP-ribosylglycohydrolase family protein [Desulfobacteraceae bacterium]|nr:ADP-ribosylglycohydrolase family protein [Desulfobacteraceae bacterium]
MNEKAKAAVLAAFVADTFALGTHWIYNTNVIDKKLGRVETLLKPEIASFHKTKERGDFTHYGDQMLVLLESVSEKKGFDLEDFSRRWQSLFSSYDGYLDHATKDTLRNFSTGASPETSGSGSTDLGGAARIAPLVAFSGEDIETLEAAARDQTSMTHQHPDVVSSAEFFARAVWHVVNGRSPIDAVGKASEDAGGIRGWIEKGMKSAGRDTREVIAEFGQMCETQAALPSVVHLVHRYEGDLKTALVENVMAGGDSAARGMLAGMLLGAHHGIDAIPGEWLEEMRARHRIEALLQAE